MADDYIQALRKHLKDFPPEEQEALIEEIRAHIESGADDPKMGTNREERRKKLMAELGSVQDMSRGFKAIYRNDRFLDYLLVAIPYLFYPFLNALYLSLMPKYSWADVRLDILIHLPLVLIGLWRRSALLTLFWTATLIMQIISMLLITQGYYGTFQVGIWIVGTLGLLIILGRTIWQNRIDPLISAYGLLPLVMYLAGSFLAMFHPGVGTSNVFGPIDIFLLKIYGNIAGVRSGYLPFYGTLATLALFFLIINRNVRWLALGLYGLVIALSHDYFVSNDSLGLMNPLIYLFYVMVPLVLIFLVWWISQAGQLAKIAE